MGLLYLGRAGRLTAKNGGLRPGQFPRRALGAEGAGAGGVEGGAADADAGEGDGWLLLKPARACHGDGIQFACDPAVLSAAVRAEARRPRTSSPPVGGLAIFTHPVDCTRDSPYKANRVGMRRTLPPMAM